MQQEVMTAAVTAKSKGAILDKQKWIVLISGWEKSKESQRAYCERLELNLNTFTYMRSQLFAVKKKQATNKFIPIKVKEETMADLAQLQIITIEINKGIKLHVPLMIDEVKLTRILKLLGMTSC